MKNTFLLLAAVCSFTWAAGQNLPGEIVYPDTLRSAVDTFYVSSQKWNAPFPYPISRDDTLRLNTSGYEGVAYIIWTDLDTLSIPHVNYPFQQSIKIPLTTQLDTALCVLTFQAVDADFNTAYVEAATGAFVITIPEVYELANVVLSLSSCSEYTKNRQDTRYAERVQTYFGTYRDHKLIEILDTYCDADGVWSTYYGFRENSLCFGFDEAGDIQYNQPYKHVRWDSAEEAGGQFRNLLYLIQDFADKSDFRKFYLEQRSYYDQLIKREYELLPIQDMWDWLQAEFPQSYDSYKVVFSPLIAGSHSTKRFQKGYPLDPSFKECVMFINSSEYIDGQALSERLKQGLRSGIVFTEIDHNYINPTSEEHAESIEALIREKELWASEKAQQHYSSEMLIFNEYMTHALFCLYAQEAYDQPTTQEILERRIQLMERRGFPKFEAFTRILLTTMNENITSVYASYSKIIEEMAQIK